MSKKILVIFLCLWFSTGLFANIDTVRIACVGNSITEGYTISNKVLDSFPAQLNILLDDNYISKNFGVSGRTMLKNGDFPLWNEQLFKDALNFQPDIVIILLGTNDSKPQNWQFRDEFIPDYVAMIDTFRQLDSKPIIFACYPPPSFSDAFSIRDSVITTDILPMIDQIVALTGVSLIDFNTPLKNSSDLFPDGIHPSVEGAWEMAKIIAKALIGREVETIKDNNLAKGKSVTVSGFIEDENYSFIPQNLNDGDGETKWASSGSGNWAIIDLGNNETIDMFQINFGKEYNHCYQYIIETSLDLLTWTRVVDQSARVDTTTQICVDKIDPLECRYVKLTITGAAYGDEQITNVYEFNILESSVLHAPVLTWKIDRIRSAVIVFNVTLTPTTNKGEMIKYMKRTSLDDPFSTSSGYRPGEVLEINSSIRAGYTHQFYALAYKDGKEIISDTLTVTWGMVTQSENNAESEIPEVFELYQNYPNPFNPETTIKFSIKNQSFASIKIFDVLGRQIQELGNRNFNPGNYAVVWDGRDYKGAYVATGVYYYCLTIDQNLSSTKRMIVVK